MRNRWMLALAAFVTLGGAANAQPAKAEPTLEVRLRSVNELVGKAEYLGGLAGQEEVVKQVRGIIKQLTADGKGLEGIDTKQPFGLTITLTADVVNSQFLLMVPIADEERFLGMLKDRLADQLTLDAEKTKEGTYKASVAVINEIHFRFTNGYVYVGRSAKDLDPKALPTPKTYFAKDDGSVASAVVRFDRIPAELKTFVVGQFELGITEQRKMNGEKESAAQKAIMDWVADNMTGGLKSLLEDAKELNARVFIDEKTDEMSVEATLTAKTGSVLAKNISSLAGKTSLPAAIVGGKNAAIHATARAGLPEGVKKDLGKVVDAAIEEIVKQAGAQEKEAVERLLKTIAPTLKAGELDAAFAVHGPDAKNRLAVVAAGAVRDGKEIEKLVKDFAPFLGQGAEFDFDVEKIGAFTLHTVTFKEIPPEVENIFGTKKLWLAISNDVVAVSFEPDGGLLKAGLKAKPVPVPALSVELAAAKLVPILGQKLKPDEVKALMKDTFGDGSPSGKDTLSVTLTGGDQLTLKGKLKGNVVRLVFTLVKLQGK